MTSFATIQTPAMLLDKARLTANCRRAHDLLAKRGVALRPHMKTLKSIDAARIAIDPRHGEIAVATIKEAEYFAEAGLSDIQLAVCLAPDKLDRAAAILKKAPDFSFFIDNLDTVKAAAAHGGAFRIWIEIDCGEHRTGLLPEDPAVLEIAKFIADHPPLRLAGVATHAGHSYSAEDKAEIADQEIRAVTDAAARLRAAGIEVRGVSAGSTPTMIHARHANGLTEVRAGVFMAGDLFQAGIESLKESEIAVSVLASVISHNRALRHIVVDAGGLAMSKDRGNGKTGYGRVVGFDGLLVAAVHQEHGEILYEDGDPVARLKVGEKVRILPNHVCMTAAMYDRYLVLDGGTEIVATWARVNGWG